jgi:hypothetical protein
VRVLQEAEKAEGDREGRLGRDQGRVRALGVERLTMKSIRKAYCRHRTRHR